MSAAVRKRPSLYATAVGKKYAMAISGLILMGYVLVHMIGNLKVYFGAESLNKYSEWLREVGEPALPREWLLWGVRFLLLAAVFGHIHAAYSLTVMNRRARPERYQAKRDYVAADFASRTMRWTGIIVFFFVIFHLLDLTWGTANPDFVHGDVYRNLIASFERTPVALVYVIANMALGVHLYHGAWSLFQSMGWFGTWRRPFSIGFAGLIVMGNVSFPLAVMFGVIN
jgi:succinate dehydrogenase / fumarate reductase, cytochrome b subunit